MRSMADTSDGQLPFSFSTDAAGAFRLLDGDASFIGHPADLSTAPDRVTETTVFAEGVPIVRVRRQAPGAPWAVVAVSCLDASHGVHQSLRPLADKIDGMMDRLVPGRRRPVCSRCDGSGWLDPSGPEALRQRSLARAFGVWRGIVNPAPVPVERVDALAALDAFLGEAALSGARGAPGQSEPNGGENDGRNHGR